MNNRPPGAGWGRASSSWLDDVKRNADLVTVAESLGHRRTGRDRLSPCPSCGAGRSRKDRRGPLLLRQGQTRWSCVLCGAWGSVADLVAFHLTGDDLDLQDPSQRESVRSWFADRGHCAGGRHDGR